MVHKKGQELRTKLECVYNYKILLIVHMHIAGSKYVIASHMHCLLLCN